LNSLKNQIYKDLYSDKKGLKSFIKEYFFNASFRVLLNHRLGKSFAKSRFKIVNYLGAYYKKKLIEKRGCDISYKSVLGSNIKLPHPIGIVIGDEVIIEDNVTIFQQVTFGSHGKRESKKEYPVIKSGAKIYAGAKIIGGVTIGHNAIIGANSLINIDVPDGSIAYGIPCKVKKMT
jgi:serine O-acetyltransferase